MKIPGAKKIATMFLLATLVMLSPSMVFAAPPKQAGPEVKAAPVVPVTASALPDRIVRPMRAITPMTLRAEGVTIRLWGIKQAYARETKLEINALEMMDGLIQEQQVNCKIVGGGMPELVGRCATQDNQDLALTLLSNGFATVNREETYDSVFATAYEQAQQAARVNAKGFWSADQKKSDKSDWMPAYFKWLLPLSLIVGPFGGLALIAFFTRNALESMNEQQKNDAERSFMKEQRLQIRERQVLITTLESELLDNKSRIEAFRVIYNDMLNELKSPDSKPKYQQGGDIIQKHPSFSALVFEANVAKLSLLDMKLAGELSRLYARLPRENAYVNIEPEVPLETAIALVEKVIKEAEEMLPPIDSAIAGLQKELASAYE